jgi:glycosyltransferase involved in cell wall biosynthesis
MSRGDSHDKLMGIDRRTKLRASTIVVTNSRNRVDVGLATIVTPPIPSNNRKVRVLHVLVEESRGGIAEGVLSTVRNLDRERFSPMLACTPALIKAFGSDLDRLGLRVYPMPRLSRPYQFAAMGRMMRILRAAAPDIVHTHLFVATMCVAPVAKLCGVSVVIESCRIREGWRQGIWKKFWIDRWVNRFVDANIAISEALRRYLIEEKGFDGGKVFLVRNGRELSRVLAPPRREAAELRREFRLNADNLVVCVPGRLAVQKGHRYLLEALPTVLGLFPNLRVLIVGDGVLREQLASDISRRGLQEQVVLTGYRKDVYDILRMCDLVVLASLFEGLPLVAIEAGALGKPIVATAVDGTPEVVLHGKTGWLVPPSNSDELAYGICRLLGDPKLRLDLGKQAQEYIAREFSFQRVVAETEGLYSRLLSEKTLRVRREN